MSTTLTFCVPLLLALLCTACSGSGSGVLWVEGEAFTAASNTVRSNTTDKPTASGGKSSFGAALDRKDLTVTYRFDVRQKLEDGQIAFRYARLHWRETMVPAPMKLTLESAAASVEREVAFPDTRGWGARPEEWHLLSVDVGALPAGTYTLTLTSLADNNSVNIDGFFVAEKTFTITTEELAALLRVQITSEGYLGYHDRSAAIRQDQTRTLAAAARSFTGDAPTLKARMVPEGKAAMDLAPSVAGQAQGGRRTASFALPELADGAYRLEISSQSPSGRVEVPLTLLGQAMSTVDARLAKLDAFVERLAGDASDHAAVCRDDLRHAAEFVRTARDTMAKSVAQASVDLRREFLAQQEGLSDPTPPAANIMTALEQSEQTMTRLAEGKHPYEGRTGAFRRAYTSKASGQARIYRSFVPTSYAKAESVPLVLMLHGGGGDENTFHDMAGGAILRELESRGYVMVAPKYNRRQQPNVMEDLMQLIELTRQQYPKISADRIYVTGISMGGGTTYMLATANPEFFAAACCVSGPGDPASADKLATTPMMLIHGGGDTVSPPARAHAMADKLKELGFKYEFHLFPDHGHEYHAALYSRLTLEFFDKVGAKKR